MADKKGGNDVSNRTAKRLCAFGNRQQPRTPRPVQDFGVSDMTDTVGPESPPLPRGASTFANVKQAPIAGHYHTLAEGIELAEGLGVVADGVDVLPDSPHPVGHHTIFRTREMTVHEFIAKFLSLGWHYGGKE